MDYGVTPDILTTAKALGNGFPIGAMLTTDEHRRAFQGRRARHDLRRQSAGRGDRGEGGRTDQRPEAARRRARNAARRSRRHLARINERFSLFKEIRGKGLLIGAELADAYKDRAKDVLNARPRHGVIMLIAGPNVLRFAPSLIMPMADLDEGFARIEKRDRRGGAAKPLRRADAGMATQRHRNR